MKYVVGLWQTSGSFVFKLKDSGSVEYKEGRPVKQLVNEVSFRVELAPVVGETPQAHALKENFLAESIAKCLNEAKT